VYAFMISIIATSY